MSDSDAALALYGLALLHSGSQRHASAAAEILHASGQRLWWAKEIATKILRLLRQQTTTAAYAPWRGENSVEPESHSTIGHALLLPDSGHQLGALIREVAKSSAGASSSDALSESGLQEVVYATYAA